LNSKVFTEIAAIVGTDSALRVVQCIGGVCFTFFVGKHIPDGLDINRDLWDALCNRFNHERVNIPVRPLLDIRNSEILARRRAGESVNSLAKSFKLSSRQILKICG
jgi:hypothetical protein